MTTRSGITKASPARRVGRPRAEGKRDAIVDQAWDMFLTRGVQGTTLEAVAKAAGVSRVTLYSHFSDKTALFEATIRREMARLEGLQKTSAAGLPLRDTLVAFGMGLMTYLTSGAAVSFYSVLAGELRRHPDLASRFYWLGPGQTLRNLTALLAAAHERGEVALPSPVRGADQLIGLWQGMSQFQLALGVGVEELVASLPERVEGGVDLFLRQHRVPC
ncbi:MAG: TetR/AcrR family transcriptional regulator [Methylobacteriaceae bacterium]|nr:TetR/AcrR family transcriptional regulator [Methylobacteriaceae bacterium]